MHDTFKEIFSEAFLKANCNVIRFPDNFHLDKINEIEFYTEGMRGGYDVRFFIKKNEVGAWYLDLFGGNDYHTWHKRITEQGEIIKLESFKGEFGRPIYPDDPERTAKEHKAIQEHNERLNKVLIAKGLTRNFDDPEFEENNVVKLTDYRWES
jgi:hypothetical protein